MPGHWEGDLIIGLDSSAIGTLVERTTRFTMLLHLPRMEGYGVEPRVKNGPPLAGHGAEAVRDAIAVDDHHAARAAAPVADLGPGKEMAQHAQLKIDTGVAGLLLPTRTVPGSAARNENTNGLLRQYFPKGTDLSRWSRRRPRRRRRRAQRPAPQDPRLEDARRGLQRAPTLAPTRQCCDHRLSLGPRQRAGPAHPDQHRRRPADLLLRPGQPLATRQQREHQRAAAAVLPQRHRPVHPRRRTPDRRRRRTQRPTPQNPALGHPRRNTQRTTLRRSRSHRCDDPMNPPTPCPYVNRLAGLVMYVLAW